MRRHPDELRQAALNTAHNQGANAAALEHHVPARTIRRWAHEDGITIPTPGRQLEAHRTTTVEATAATQASRATRHAETQHALTSIAATQLPITRDTQQAAARIVTGLLLLLEQLDAETDPEQRDLLESRVDRTVERARKIAVAVGIHVDKVLKLAGEDSGVAPVQSGSTTIVTNLLVSDPVFRRAVTSGLAARYESFTALEATGTEGGS